MRTRCLLNRFGAALTSQDPRRQKLVAAVPARYCTGYLGDIGVPPDPSPMDFSTRIEVYLGDRWYTFDAATTGRASAVF